VIGERKGPLAGSKKFGFKLDTTMFRGRRSYSNRVVLPHDGGAVKAFDAVTSAAIGHGRQAGVLEKGIF
jgi:hypothetical protein